MIFFSKELATGRLSEDLATSIIELYKKYNENLISKSKKTTKLIGKSFNDYIFIGINHDEEGEYIGYKSPSNIIEKIYIISGKNKNSFRKYLGLEVWYQELIFDEVEEIYMVNILFTNRKETSIKIRLIK